LNETSHFTPKLEVLPFDETTPLRRFVAGRLMKNHGNRSIRTGSESNEDFAERLHDPK
jgi:hypothetical protein